MSKDYSLGDYFPHADVSVTGHMSYDLSLQQASELHAFSQRRAKGTKVKHISQGHTAVGTRAGI